MLKSYFNTNSNAPDHVFYNRTGRKKSPSLKKLVGVSLLSEGTVKTELVRSLGELLHFELIWIHTLLYFSSSQTNLGLACRCYRLEQKWEIVFCPLGSQKQSLSHEHNETCEICLLNVVELAAVPVDLSESSCWRVAGGEWSNGSGQTV